MFLLKASWTHTPSARSLALFVSFVGSLCLIHPLRSFDELFTNLADRGFNTLQFLYHKDMDRCNLEEQICGAAEMVDVKGVGLYGCGAKYPVIKSGWHGSKDCYCDQSLGFTNCLGNIKNSNKSIDQIVLNSDKVNRDPAINYTNKLIWGIFIGSLGLYYFSIFIYFIITYCFCKQITYQKRESIKGKPISK